jgi:hypothetical protein
VQLIGSHLVVEMVEGGGLAVVLATGNLALRPRLRQALRRWSAPLPQMTPRPPRRAGPATLDERMSGAVEELGTAARA